MKKALFVLLAICVLSVVTLTILVINTRNNSLEIGDLNVPDKKEEVQTPPPEPKPTNREIIAQSLTLDNLTPDDVASFLNLDPEAPATSEDTLARQVGRLSTFSGLLQAADEQSVTIAPLFDAPESFALVSNSKIERNNEVNPWQKLVKGDRIDLIALDGQVVRLVSSGLITKTDIKETVSEATSIPPELIDKLLSGDTKGLETDALTRIKTFLATNYGIPAGTLDALLSGDLSVSREMIEQLVLGKLIGALGTGTPTADTRS